MRLLRLGLLSEQTTRSTKHYHIHGATKKPLPQSASFMKAADGHSRFVQLNFYSFKIADS